MFRPLAKDNWKSVKFPAFCSYILNTITTDFFFFFQWISSKETPNAWLRNDFILQKLFDRFSFVHLPNFCISGNAYCKKKDGLCMSSTLNMCVCHKHKLNFLTYTFSVKQKNLSSYSDGNALLVQCQVDDIVHLEILHCNCATK